MRKSLAIFAFASLGLAAPALADVTVRYKAVIPDSAPADVRADPPTLTVAADDAGQVRLEMQAPGAAPGVPRPGVALITREGVGYVALSGPQPELRLVARQEDALALVAQFAAPLARGSAREGAAQLIRQRVEIVPAGPETVAGVRGNLYRIVQVDGETRSPLVEIVVSGDPRLAPVGRELVRLADSLRPTVVAILGGEPQALAAIRGLLGLGAPLRIGDQMRLDTISTADLPDDHFALPGPVLTREQLMQAVGAMTGGRPPGGDAPAGDAPNPR